MDQLVRELRHYLSVTLGVNVSSRSWKDKHGLPFHLQDGFQYLQVKLVNSPCLLMVAREEAEQAPASVKKYIEKVRELWKGEIIFVRRNISSYNRRRLIEHKVSFIVPNNQMYLPLLGIDLREHFTEIRKVRKQFRPSTQAVILLALFGEPVEKYTPKEMASKLGYSNMALTRSFDELMAVGIGKISQIGRERILKFPVNKRNLWEQVRPYMISPVKKRIRVETLETGWGRVCAGLTALARYSMLAEPDLQTYAISSKAWNEKLRNNAVVQLPTIAAEAYELEIWAYDPFLFSHDGVADPCSLYLSLQNSADERVESSLQEMMERIVW